MHYRQRRTHSARLHPVLRAESASCADQPDINPLNRLTVFGVSGISPAEVEFTLPSNESLRLHAK